MSEKIIGYFRINEKGREYHRKSGISWLNNMKVGVDYKFPFTKKIKGKDFEWSFTAHSSVPSYGGSTFCNGFIEEVPGKPNKVLQFMEAK